MRFKRNTGALGGPGPVRRGRLRTGIGAVAAAVTVLLGSALAADAAGPAAAPAGPPASPAAPAPPPGFQRGFVKVDGGYLHYVKGGSGPALVLLHGWPETWYEWHKVMPGLARDHTVIAFDLPGLGSSTIPADRAYDAATVAARIHQGVTRLGHASAGLLAHDVGALVAYPYARLFPGSVSRMAVLETPLNGFGLEAAYGASWHFLFNQTAAPVPEELIDDRADVATYLGWLFGSTVHPDKIAQSAYIDAYAGAARRGAGFGYYRAFPANAAKNKELSAQKVTVPVLAMGAQAVFGPAVGQSFGQVATDVRTVVAPDSGHWIPEENPAFLAQCAALFFGGGGQAPPAGMEGCAP